MERTDQLIVYVDPWDKNLLNGLLFNYENNLEKRADYLSPFIFLKEYCQKNNVIIETADKIPFQTSKSKKYLYYSLGQLDGYRILNNRSDIVFGSFYIFEPPIKVLPKAIDINYHLDELVSKFNRVYTTSPIKAINNCYGLNYTFETNLFCYPQSHTSIIENIWINNDRKFLVMVNSYRYSRLMRNEYYSERIYALKYFLSNNSIDLYGGEWQKVSNNFLLNLFISSLWAIKWRSFARLRDLVNSWSIRSKLKSVNASNDKYATLSKYKFAICYESMGIEGFVSEKIFDCFVAGTIPIYLGAKDIEKYVPKNTFIDKRLFKDYKELDNYIRGMSENEYKTYRQNIRDYLLSPLYSKFTKEYFAKQFLENIIKDSDMITN